MYENDISSIIVDSALRIHKPLGPGLLESVYEKCLAYELNKKGLSIEVQRGIPLSYYDVYLDCGYRADIIVENKVIVEIKSVEALNDVHLAQILTYLRLSGCKLGLLINFNVCLLKEGIRRVVNGL